MDWDSLFRPAADKLRDPDEIVQGDAGVELFQAWYQMAAKFAKGELHGVPDMVNGTERCMLALVASNVPGLLSRPNTDDYVVSALMDNLRKIILILKTKPKFHALLEGNEGVPFAEFVQQRVVSELQRAAFSPGAHIPNKIECLKTITALLDLGQELAANPATPFQASPFGVPLEIVMPPTLSPNLEMMHRQALLDLVEALGRMTNMRGAVLHALAFGAADAEALDLAWRLGGLGSKQFVDTLLQRVRQSAGGQGSAAVAGVTLSGAVCTSLLSLASHGHRRDDTGGVDIAIHLNSIMALVEACDAIKSNYKENAEERSPEVIELASVLLGLNPNEARLVHFALAPPFTIESLSMLAARSEAFSADVWLDILLPFLYQRIASMQLQGVSGSQIEQDTINLLRDCPRVFYINRDKNPTFALGRYVYHTIIQAIRHGYIETERFPYVAALVLETHVAEGSVAWLGETLAETVCDTHRTFRAVEEIVSQLLGISSAAGEREQAVPVEQQQQVLQTIASAPTGPAFNLMTNICRLNPNFAMEQEPVVRTLLDTLSRVLRDLAKRGGVDKRMLESIVALVNSLALRISPANAPALFEIALQSFAILPPDAEGGFEDDVTLECIAKKIPTNAPLSASAIDRALRTAGPNTRYELAAFVPEKCIRDPIGAVRAQALRVLQRRPDVLYKHARDVFACVQSPGDFNTKYREAHLRMSELDFCHAAAPLMSMLALRDTPNNLSPAMLYLAHAAKITSANDALYRAPDITREIDRVARELDVDLLVHVLSSAPELVKILPKLEKLSSPWARLIQALSTAGVLSHSPLGYSFNKKKAKVHAPPAYSEVEMTSPEQAPTSAAPADSMAGMVAAVERGELMAAVRAANSMRVREADRYAGEGRPYLMATILPGVAATVLPVASQVDGRPSFRPQVLEEYGRHAAVMDELAMLCPDEAETVLQLAARRNDLNLAMVHRFLDQGSAAGARKWIAANGIHSPGLQTVIDRWEVQHAEQKTPQSSSARAITRLPPPPRPTRARGTYQGATEHQLLELDSISVETAVPQANNDVWAEIGNMERQTPAAGRATSRKTQQEPAMFA